MVEFPDIYVFQSAADDIFAQLLDAGIAPSSRIPSATRSSARVSAISRDGSNRAAFYRRGGDINFVARTSAEILLAAHGELTENSLALSVRHV